MVAWAAVSPVSDRCCYAGVAEASLYVGRDHGSRAIGAALLRAVIDLSEEHGIWTQQAGIFPENAARLALGKKRGFPLANRESANLSLGFSSACDDLEELAGRHILRVMPHGGEVFGIAGDQIRRSRRLGTLQEDVVIRIGAGANSFLGSNPKGLGADGLEGGGHNPRIEAEPWPADDFLVLRKNFTGDTKRQRPAECQQEDLSWRAERLQER